MERLLCRVAASDVIREDNRDGGLRVRLTGRIGNGRCAWQIDVGFGDAVTPEPQTVVFPVLLVRLLHTLSGRRQRQQRRRRMASPGEWG